MNIRLPMKQRSGGQSKEAGELYLDSLRNFADDMKEIQSGLDFRMGARGWCYALEPYGLPKDQFDRAQKEIQKCRLLGFLQPGFILEEEGHEVERQKDDSQSVEDYTNGQYEDYQNAGEYFKESWRFYDGVSFWDMQGCYIQILVEKVELKSLFRKICKKYRIPIANLRGWGSMEQKAVMAEKFREMEQEGKKPVLLTCGDFDPAGLCISAVLKKQFKEYELFTGWNPDNLQVERIGLDYDFIQENKLTWIDNLISASKKDISNPKHEFYINNVYGVRDYIAKYGARKCEANAVVIVPELGRKMLQDSIDDFLGADAYSKYETIIYERKLEAEKQIEEIIDNE